MTTLSNDLLKVDVPVGFLLSQPRDILVSVDRAGEAPLSIRLRLIPAETEETADLGALPTRSSHDTPMPMRRLSRKRMGEDYPADDLGGSD
jgi:hypothetical protein